jgi:hypothetical protein
MERLLLLVNNDDEKEQKRLNKVVLEMTLFKG